MSDLIDITEDYLVFDNLITVTYTPFTAPRTAVTIENVKRYPATQVPASVGGTSVPTVGTKFCIFKNELGYAPEPNGKLVDEDTGRTYRILGNVETSWSNRWVITGIIDAGETL